MGTLDFILIFIIFASGCAILLVRVKLPFLAALIRTPKDIFEVKQADAGGADYNTYHMRYLEKLGTMAAAAVGLFLIGYIFYRSVLLALLLTPFCLAYPPMRVNRIIKNRKNEVKMQFKDALQSISASLQAGKSFESAMKSAVNDLQIQYDEDSYIMNEFRMIIRKLDSNETIEKAFQDFAARTGIEEIQSFAETLEICKRTGGNLVSAIKSSTDIITGKIEVLNEIQGILAQKKLEQNILTAMPIVLILMLSTSAKDFMEPVFTEIIGRLVMTFSILLFAAAYIIADKITNIEV